MKIRVSDKFSAVTNWIVCKASRFDTRWLREDFRKVGLVFLGAGFVGIVLDGDTITLIEGLILVVVGIIFWLAGLYKSEGD